MTIKTKIAVCIAIMAMGLCMLIAGVFALTPQKITMHGDFVFDVSDRNLYVRDICVQPDNETPRTLTGFNRGYIGDELSLNLSANDIIEGNYNSITLYFDIVNLYIGDQTSQYNASARWTGSAVAGVSFEIVESSNLIEEATTTQEDFDESTPLSGTIALKINLTAGTDFDLSNITIAFSDFFNQLVGFTFTVDDSDNTAALVSYTGSERDVTIPQTISTRVVDGQTIFIEGNKYTVTSIANGSNDTSGAFYQVRNTLQSVSIPETVTSIGNYAFRGCSSLSSINIPTRLTSFGMHAFYGCSNLTGTLTIPAGITSLRILTFYNTGFTKLQFASGSKLTSIGYEAFRESSLTTIDFANATLLTEIGDYSFYGCTGLTAVTIPNSVSYIRQNAFNGCSNLSEVRIGSKVTSIETNAFANCPSLTTVFIDSASVASQLSNTTACGNLISNADVIYVRTTVAGSLSSTFPFVLDTTGAQVSGYNKYINATILTGFEFTTNDNDGTASLVSYTGSASSVTIPSGISRIVIDGQSVFVIGDDYTVTTIADGGYDMDTYTFVGAFTSVASTIRSVTLPNTLTRIGSYAFYGCRSLTGTMTIPASVNSIGDYAFSSCSGLTRLTFASGSQLQTIGDYAFNDCTGLTGTLTIPSNVTSIGANAFNSCSRLTGTLNLPASLITIGSNAFYGCSGLTRLTFASGSQLQTIGGGAFNSCTSLQTATIPSNVTSIGSNAFNYCDNLSTVYIDSESVASQLSSITACGYLINNASVVFVRENIIGSLHAEFSFIFIRDDEGAQQSGYVRYITLTVEFIEDFEFEITSETEKTVSLVRYTGSATSVSVPATVSKMVINDETYFIKGTDYDVTSIADGNETDYGAFYQVRNTLQSVTLPGTLTSIGSYAFTYCTRLTSITLPNSLRSIGDDAFRSAGLTSIAFPANLTTVGGYAFYMSDLTSVNFATNGKLTTISDYMFGGCTGLSSIVLPEGVTTIGNGAFYQCSGLQQITISSKVNSIGTSAFNNCSNLATVIIDSASIASQLYNTETACGYLIRNASAVFVKQDIVDSLHASFPLMLDTTGTQMAGYNKYVPATIEEIADFIFTSDDDDMTASLVRYAGSATSVTIPSTVSKVYIGNREVYIEGTDYRVTSIADGSSNSNGAFYSVRASLRSVTLPSNLTYIGNYAFYGCSALTGISFPTGVTTIGDSSFYGCGLTGTLTLPTSLTYLGQQAFYNCSGLTGTLTIPAGITQLRLTSFYNCTGLTKLQFASGNSLASIGYQAFLQCSGLAEIDFTNATSLTEIGHYAFQNCTSLTNVTLPSSVLQIRQSAFAGCSNLSEVRIGNNVTLIETDAFTGCTSLATVYIDSASVASQLSSTTACGNILANANTVYVRSTASASLASFVTENYAKVSSTVSGYDKYIRDYTLFDGFTFTISGSTASLVSYNGSAANVDVPSSISTATLGGETVYIAGDDYIVTSIADANGMIGAFTRAATTLQKVVLPNTLTHIGNRAFYNCININEITMPAVVTIGDGAFSTCRSLPAITLPNTLVSIGSTAFYGCNNLTSVNLPANVNTIGEAAFAECTKLASINIPNGVTTINIDTFQNCSSLTSINIPSSVRSIGADAFAGCSSLATVFIDSSTIASGLTSASVYGGLIANADIVYIKTGLTPASWLSANYSKLSASDQSGYDMYIKGELITDFQFTDNGTTASLVKYTGSASSVTIPSTISKRVVGSTAYYIVGSDLTVTSIASASSAANGAFYNKTGLQAVILPSNLTQIGAFAFYGCNNLTSVTLPANVNTIGEGAFAECTKLASINIPNGVTTINIDTFQNCSSLTSINIPSSVRSIGTDAFAGCTGLAMAYIDSASIASQLSSTTACGNLISNAYIVYVNDNAVGSLSSTFPFTLDTEGAQVAGYKKYLSPNVYTDFTFKTNEKTAMFTKYTGSAASVTIPSTVSKVVLNGETLYVVGSEYSVESVGAQAIWQNNDILEVIVPANVTTIAQNGIGNNPNLTKLTFVSGSKLQTIGTAAFIDNSSLQSIAIPGSVTRIETAAFSGCSSLAVVYVDGVGVAVDLSDRTVCGSLLENASIVYIKDTAEVALPSDFTSMFTKVTSDVAGYAKYADLTSLEGFVFTTNDNDMTASLVSYTGSASSVIIPSRISKVTVDGSTVYVKGNDYTVTSIADGTSSTGAFKSVASTLQSVTLPNELQKIGNYAFYTCRLLSSITIPSSVTSIGTQAFTSCSGLTSVIFEEGSQLKTIASWAFNSCTGLSSIVIPENVTSIASYGFFSCDNLSSVYIDSPRIASQLSSNTSAGYLIYFAFIVFVEEGAATQLPTTFPGTLDTEGAQVEGYKKYITNSIYTDFEFTTDDTDMTASLVRYTGSASNVSVPSSISKAVIEGEVVYGAGSQYTVTSIADGSRDVLTGVDGAFTSVASTLQDVTLPNTLTRIGSYAFYECSGLSGALTIPASVTSIGDYAYTHCSSLTSLSFASGSKLQTIGTSAFAGCEGLTGTLTIPASVISIGASAFSDINGMDEPGACTSLTYLIFASGSQLQVIGKDAFSGCTGLTGTLTIPANVTSIGDYAFANCSSLTTLYLASGSKLQTIGVYAFRDCTGLTGTLTIPANVTSIGSFAFYECSELTGLGFASGSKLRTIGDYAFCGTSLTGALTIPSRVTTIGDYAFSSCEGLTSLTFAGTQLRTIGDSAFSSCSGLAGTLTLPLGVTTIGEDAFRWCENLGAELTIPASVTSIGNDAFYGCTGLTEVQIYSEAIIKQLDSDTAAGCVAYYAQYLMLNADVPDSEVPRGLLDYFTLVWSGGGTLWYDAYERHYTSSYHPTV